ncbi:MAG TPA: hypothetical protein VL551_11760 [Actinospica sp.]|jgi:hypothetical protein|nr:hypothetical protein [Actinospica sp.]
MALAADPADPMQMVALPALVLDTVVAQFPRLPAGRCVDDCVVLMHAYADLGIRAQVRAAVITVTGGGDGEFFVHGALVPQWTGEVFDGHTVLWLPDAGYLVDPTAQQFPEIAEHGSGPILAWADGSGADGGAVRVRLRRGTARVGYSLALAEVGAAVLGHRVARAEAQRNRDRGMNVAATVVETLAELLDPVDAARIPHPRGCALVRAAHGLPCVVDDSGFRRFLVSGPGGQAAVRLDQIPLPSGTAPRAAVSVHE